MADLSKLDHAAALAYDLQLNELLADPGRLRAVHSAQFAAEPVRDRLKIICDTALKMFNADGCEINMITDTEQIDVVSGARHDVHETLCRYVVSENAPFGVESTTTHALVCTTQAVTLGGLRSYLGLPLLWDNQRVGAFCVYTFVEREWKQHEVQALATLAVTVMDTLHWDDDKS